MTNEQMEAITHLFAGLEIALVNLVDQLQASGATNRAAFAAGLRATAAALPPGPAQPRVALVLSQIVRLLEGSPTPGEPSHADELKRLLH